MTYSTEYQQTQLSGKPAKSNIQLLRCTTQPSGKERSHHLFSLFQKASVFPTAFLRRNYNCQFHIFNKAKYHLFYALLLQVAAWLLSCSYAGEVELRRRFPSHQAWRCTAWVITIWHSHSLQARKFSNSSFGDLSHIWPTYFSPQSYSTT